LSPKDLPHREAGAPRFVVVTGMSGAGKTQAVKVFEDLDYYILDNLPPALMPSALIECRRGGGQLCTSGRCDLPHGRPVIYTKVLN